MIAAYVLLAALIVVAVSRFIRHTASKHADIANWRDQEVVYEGFHHARERHRRCLQIARGILRRENGLGVVVAPRPARAMSPARATRRRYLRRMRPILEARARGRNLSA